MVSKLKELLNILPRYTGAFKWINIRRLAKNSRHENQLALSDATRRLDKRLKNRRWNTGASPLLEFDNVSIKCLGGNEVVGVFRRPYRKWRLPLPRSSQPNLRAPPQFPFGPSLPRKNVYYAHQSLEGTSDASSLLGFLSGRQPQDEDQCFAPRYHDLSGFQDVEGAQYFEMRFARYLNDPTFLEERVKRQGRELAQTRAQLLVETSAQEVLVRDLETLGRSPMGRRWEDMAAVTDHLDIWRVGRRGINVVGWC